MQKHIFDNIETFCKNWLLGRKIDKELELYEEWYFFIKINAYKIKINFVLYKNLS